MGGRSVVIMIRFEFKQLQVKVSALEESETGDASEVRDNQSSEIFIDLPSANSSAATECSSPTSEVSTATANQDSSPSTSSAQDSNLESSAEPSQKVHILKGIEDHLKGYNQDTLISHVS